MSFPTDRRTFIKSNYLGQSNETTAASGVSKVEDTKDGQRSTPKTIMMFTPVKDETINKFATELKSDFANAGVSYEHVALAGKDLASEITRLRANGTIGNDTQIFISMHGSNASGVQLLLGEERDRSDNSANAIDVLNAIRRPAGENTEPCSATVYFASCHAGGKDFAQRVQDLHNDAKVGVCFLLSGKGDVAEAESDAAVRAVSRAFITEKRFSGAAPGPEHIGALLSAQAGDCMSMIVANEAHPRRFHRAESLANAGVDALIAAIDDSAMVYSDKGIFRGLSSAMQENKTSDFSEPAERKHARFPVSGDSEALRRHRDELGKLKDRNIEDSQPSRIASSIAAKSELKYLEQIIQDSPKFKEINSSKWNGAHDDAASLLIDLNSDKKQVRRIEKGKYIMSLLEIPLGNAEPQKHLEVVGMISLRAPVVFAELDVSLFFRKTEGNILKIANISQIIAMDSTFKHLKKIFDTATGATGLLSPATFGQEWQDHLASENFQQGHVLALAMLDGAARNENGGESDLISDYVIGEIREASCESVFKEQALYIKKEWPAALKILEQANII